MYIPILQICLNTDIRNNTLMANVIRHDNLTVYTCMNKSLINLHPDAFKSIPEISTSITHFSLDYNKITILHKHQFKGLTNLIRISLKYNSLTIITKEIFRYNTQLRIIILSHNNIAIFNADLRKLHDLKTLYISYNKLKTLNEYSFKSYISGNESNNRYLSVVNNILNCNCSMYWILKLNDTTRAYILYDRSCNDTDDVSNSTVHTTPLHCFMSPMSLETSKCEHLRITYCDGLYLILLYIYLKY